MYCRQAPAVCCIKINDKRDSTTDKTADTPQMIRSSASCLTPNSTLAKSHSLTFYPCVFFLARFFFLFLVHLAVRVLLLMSACLTQIPLPLDISYSCRYLLNHLQHSKLVNLLFN